MDRPDIRANQKEGDMDWFQSTKVKEQPSGGGQVQFLFSFALNRSANVEFVDGPKRLLSFGSTVQLLVLSFPRSLHPLLTSSCQQQHIAEPTQFISVKYKDGRAEYIPGPAAVWEDPLLHHYVGVKHSISVNSNEAIVIYHETAGKESFLSSDVLRRISS